MYSALIVAAGSGKRTGLAYNKNLHPLCGKPMILHSIESFAKDADCESVLVVVSEDEISLFRKHLPEDVVVVRGGDSRQASVFNGLKQITSEYVFIHDGARPNLKHEAIERLKVALIKHEAATLAVKARDTLKKCLGGEIVDDVDRNTTFMIQTPQAFKTKMIYDAHVLARSKYHAYSDDTSVFQHELGKKVFIVPGYDDNIKVTTMADFKLLEALI